MRHRWRIAIGVSHVQQQVQQAWRQRRAAHTGIAEQGNRGVGDKARLFTLGEAVNGGAALGGVQLQVIHHGPRRRDFRLRDPAIGLGDVPHQLKGGGEKDPAHPLVAQVIRLLGRLLAALVEIVAERRAQQRAQRTAHHEAKGSTQHFSPHDCL